jgi:hypothetical protein
MTADRTGGHDRTRDHGRHRPGGDTRDALRPIGESDSVGGYAGDWVGWWWCWCIVLLVDAGPQANRGVSWTIDQDQKACLPSIGSA